MFTTALALLFLVKLFFKTNFYAPNYNKIRFVNSDKYLGVYLSSTLNDDDDIARQVRYRTCIAVPIY